MESTAAIFRQSAGYVLYFSIVSFQNFVFFIFLLSQLYDLILKSLSILFFFPTFFLFPIFFQLICISLCISSGFVRPSFSLSIGLSLSFLSFQWFFLCSNAKPSIWICYIYLSVVFRSFSILSPCVCVLLCLCLCVCICRAHFSSHFC